MHMRSYSALFGAAIIMLGARTALAGTVALSVGPSGLYRTISAAVAAADADTNASDYYVINVAPGTYTNDFSTVTRPMTIQSNTVGGAVILNATVPLPNEKGIILNFSNLIVDGLTFQGAEISNGLGGNGAGIRDQNTTLGTVSTAGPYLIVLNSSFVNNQTGILTGYNSAQSILVSKSTFINNGNPNVNYYQHALYVNYAGSLTVSSSVFCGQLIGHDIKSRAMVTSVSDNQLYDGQADPAIGCNAGSTSFAIEIANGGIASISGNQIIQGVASPNYTMVSYGEEGLLYSTNLVLASYNTFTNIGPNRATGILESSACIPIELIGDTFTGVATPVSPPIAPSTNNRGASSGAFRPPRRARGALDRVRPSLSPMRPQRLAQRVIEPLVIESALERRQLLAKFPGRRRHRARLESIAVAPPLDQSEMVRVAGPSQHVEAQISRTVAPGFGQRSSEIGYAVLAGGKDIDVGQNRDRQGSAGPGRPLDREAVKGSHLEWAGQDRLQLVAKRARRCARRMRRGGGLAMPSREQRQAVRPADFGERFEPGIARFFAATYGQLPGQRRGLQRGRRGDLNIGHGVDRLPAGGFPGIHHAAAGARRKRQSGSRAIWLTRSISHARYSRM